MDYKDLISAYANTEEIKEKYKLDVAVSNENIFKCIDKVNVILEKIDFYNQYKLVSLYDFSVHQCLRNIISNDIQGYLTEENILYHEGLNLMTLSEISNGNILYRFSTKDGESYDNFNNKSGWTIEFSVNIENNAWHGPRWNTNNELNLFINITEAFYDTFSSHISVLNIPFSIIENIDLEKHLLNILEKNKMECALYMNEFNKKLKIENELRTERKIKSLLEDIERLKNQEIPM